MAINNTLNNKYNQGFTTQAGVNVTQVTLTAASTQMQVMTGTAVNAGFTLPTSSTVPNGTTFTIINLGTQAIKVNSSGGNLIASLPAGANAVFAMVNNSVTTAAAWSLCNGVPLITQYLSDSIGVTPLFGTGSAGSVTGLCNYVRINKVMTFDLYLSWSNLTGASSGSVTIPGLPVTIPGTYSGVCSIYASNVTYASGHLVAAVQATSSIVSLYTQVSGAGLTALPSTAIAATTQMSITGTVITN